MGNSLDDLLKKAYAEENLTREDILESKGFLSTGNLAFDYKLGGYGLPRGRTAEFYGPSQSAKTTAALEAAVVCQREGGTVLYIDFEQALDTKYMRSVGLDVDAPSFKPFPAGTLERGMDFARAAVETGEVDLAIFDSVPAMVPASSAGSEDLSRTMAMERARLLGAACAALNPLLARTGATAIFINHERDVINTSGMPQRGPAQKTTAGGTALKFYASVRVQFSVVKKFTTENVDPISGEIEKHAHSQLSKLRVTKNKIDSPDQSAEVYVEFGKGFNNAYSALAVLIANKVVTKSGAFFRFPEELYHGQMSVPKNGKGGQMQGLAAILELAEFDPSWEKLIVDRARDLLGNLKPDDTRPADDQLSEAPPDEPELADTDSGVQTAPFVPTPPMQEPDPPAPVPAAAPAPVQRRSTVPEATMNLLL